MDDSPDVYVSRREERAWEPDDDVGGSAHMLFDHGRTKVGLWRADAGTARGTVEVPIAARETLLVLEGSVRVAVDRGEPVALGEGDMMSIPAGAIVGWDADPDCVVLWAYS